MLIGRATMNQKYYIFYILIIPYIVLVIRQGEASESLNFCFNSTLQGFRLNAIVWLNKSVSEWIDCVIECVKEPCCRSVNYKNTFQNEPNCEMLHDVIYNTSGKVLERNSPYDYVYLVDPQKDYNASCFVVEDNIKVAEKDCAHFYESGERKDGVYTIDPDGFGTFQVWCDMQTVGGWTVFQRRQDGSVNFFLDWSEYKVGFGNLSGEFWLGLDNIHRLTKSNQSVLRVDLMDIDGSKGYAQYMSFSVASDAESYKLNVGNFSGNAGDSLSYHNGMMFTTKDRDNDKKDIENCATARTGAWWFNSCSRSNLNGRYRLKIKWHKWKNNGNSMKKVEIKIRPIQF